MRRIIVLVTAMLVLVPVDASPAMAHSDTGLLALEAAPSGEPLGVRVRARLVYANDREPVSTATVTVAATGPNGATVAPVAVTSDGDGVYTTVLRLPAAGAWTVRASSPAPAASAEVSYEAAAAPATTAPTTTTIPTTTSAPTPTTTASVGADGTVHHDGGFSWLLAVGAAALALALGAALVKLRRR